MIFACLALAVLAVAAGAVYEHVRTAAAQRRDHAEQRRLAEEGR